jgi:hypothetical protein
VGVVIEAVVLASAAPVEISDALRKRLILLDDVVQALTKHSEF